VDLGYFGDGAQLAADLVNTHSWFSGRERLNGVEDVRAFLQSRGQSQRVNKAELPKLFALRDRLREIFAAGDGELTRRRLNALLADFPTRPQLAGDDPGVTFEPIGSDATSWIGAHAALGIVHQRVDDFAEIFGPVLADKLGHSAFAEIGSRDQGAEVSHVVAGRAHVREQDAPDVVDVLAGFFDLDRRHAQAFVENLGRLAGKTGRRHAADFADMADGD